MQSIVARLVRGAAIAALACAFQPSHAAVSENPCSAVPADTPDAAACALAATLQTDFVYPEQAARYAAMLRTNVAEGRYSALSGEAAAKAMTRDLQAVQADGHLQVHLRDPSAKDDAPRLAPPSGFAFIEQPGWIAPGVAYIRLNAFPHDEEVTARVAAFMAEHADAKALIFDLRTNHGGGLDQMDAIFPWLFAGPTPLLTMATRRSVDETRGAPSKGKPTMKELRSTADEVFRQHWALPNSDARLRRAKVYLLTSPASVSAAEHFALAMKRTHRATIVGAPTGGANHFGGTVDLLGGYYAFVPVGRTFDPDTGKDWEGTGVAPDVSIDPARALEWVLTDLGLRQAEAQRLSASHMPTEPMARERLGA